MEYYEQIVKNRHSCRMFADKKVEDDKLTELLTYYDDEESVLVEGIGTELRFYIGSVWDKIKEAVGYNGYAIKAPVYWSSTLMRHLIIWKTPATSLRVLRSR